MIFDDSNAIHLKIFCSTIEFCKNTHDLDLQLLKILPKFDKSLKSLLQVTNFFRKIFLMILFRTTNAIQGEIYS